MESITRIGKWPLVVWVIILAIVLSGCQSIAIEDLADVISTSISESEVDTIASPIPADRSTDEPDIAEVTVKKGQRYSTRDEVAVYINDFHVLPPNFITKAEAQKLGWDNSKGNLWEVTDRKSIGGDRFMNLEGLLPKAQGRQYYECDINYDGGYRGAERIVYSNDGLIYYTGDHYQTFIRLY
jgi:ribonuclease T1